MSSSPFLPLPAGLDIVRTETIEDQVLVEILSTKSTASCPLCFSPSSRIHSRYIRTVADLPCAGFRVRLLLHVRKFFCSTVQCPRRIFTERILAFVQPWARLSNRLVQALQTLGLASSAQVSERIGPRLGMQASGPTHVRLLRALPDPPRTSVRKVGLDDWSLKKGKSYGTIFVDLETRRPIDLIADRTSEAVLPWLTSHPNVEVVTRDRAGAYAEAVRLALPHAVQVADQFHLIQNLRDHVQRFLDRKQDALPLIQPREQMAPAAEGAGRMDLSVLPSKQRRTALNRSKRLARYEEVMALYRTGMTKEAIARQMHIAASTVSAFIQSQGFPERAGQQHNRQMTAYLPHIQQRWQEGCRDPFVVFTELQTQGYTGPAVVVTRLFELWQTGTIISSRGRPRKEPSPRRLSSRRAAFLMISSAQKRTARQKQWIQQMCQDQEVHQVFLLSQSFVKSLNGRNAPALENWLKRARKSHSMEIRNFVKGIDLDAAAVQAAFSLHWSNGITEGHINRLKLIKRQMYGRAHIDLLRIKVLHAA
jgi:transposase